MKRLLALVAGGLGLGVLLKRRSRSTSDPSPADDLRAKLAASKAQEPAAVAPEPQAAPDPEAHVEREPEAHVEPEPQVEPAAVEERRAGVHAKAREAIDDLR